MTNKRKSLVFDPRIFISPPFIECPKCKQIQFGVLSINSNTYSRRCKKCLYPVGTDNSALYYLPELNKKIIYLDQFAISEMMKILNPKTKAHQKGTVRTVWLDVFEKVHRLCKMQLIVCPDSNYHHDESIVSPFFSELKIIYELFSFGITFQDNFYIQNRQIYEHAECWLKGEKYVPTFSAEEITNDQINAWQDRLLISVDLGKSDKLVNDARKSREEIHKNMERLFEFWKTEEEKSFNDFYERESKYYGKNIFDGYLSYLNKWQNLYPETESELIDLCFPPNNVIIIQQLNSIFEKNGIDQSKIIEKIGEYLLSPHFDEIPFVKISALLIAGLAWRAISGQKKSPNKGMANDIFIVATFAPYVDAIFIDNGCFSLISENPINEYLSEYKTRFFCQNTLKDFFDYLDQIEKDAPEHHQSFLNQVYGDKWLKPYFEVFK